MAKAAFLVQGMSCGNCVKHVTKAVSKLPSVTDVKVDIGHVELAYDASQVSVQAIAEAITKAGYQATPQVGIVG